MLGINFRNLEQWVIQVIQVIAHVEYWVFFEEYLLNAFMPLVII